MTPNPERLTAASSNRYRLERELGQGGMATVYLAGDLRHHRRVAIKVPKPGLAAVPAPSAPSRRSPPTAELQHLHILPLFERASLTDPDPSAHREHTQLYEHFRNLQQLAG